MKPTLLLFVLTGIICLGVYAENQAPTSPVPLVTVPPPAPLKPTLKRLDEDFFDTSEEEQRSPDAEVDSTGKRRYYDPGYGEYTEKQQKDIREKCGTDSDCAKTERKKIRRELDAAEAAIERKQGRELRNRITPKVPAPGSK